MDDDATAIHLFFKGRQEEISGNTKVSYKGYELNKNFDNKYFGVEVSATTQSAYERDSTFWETTRTEPLTQKGATLVRYKDSIYTATHTENYLDSMDMVMNKITLKNVIFYGQTYLTIIIKKDIGIFTR